MKFLDIHYSGIFQSSSLPIPAHKKKKNVSWFYYNQLGISPFPYFVPPIIFVTFPLMLFFWTKRKEGSLEYWEDTHIFKPVHVISMIIHNLCLCVCSFLFLFFWLLRNIWYGFYHWKFWVFSWVTSNHRKDRKTFEM